MISSSHFTLTTAPGVGVSISLHLAAEVLYASSFGRSMVASAESVGFKVGSATMKVLELS